MVSSLARVRLYDLNNLEFEKPETVDRPSCAHFETQTCTMPKSAESEQAAALCL
ncbi:uncharacterized protein BO80DRAFT_423459 [Aspergillus ibericus CBS 121593]|uniref:Uncharacterized protein n=1 Tax=Aspergillus ibericus CBS 121593 TaxID=1448316 RepID=A0A395H761_9EURO|nr:hypothetical protein BO80DRAFT_423459 [Aspergillus ibericus CBS 121593]RAL03005.1 hypothetical protein BO80DRAFT_423459 [Aspergillus ibericus CBS 121593]